MNKSKKSQWPAFAVLFATIFGLTTAKTSRADEDVDKAAMRAVCAETGGNFIESGPAYGCEWDAGTDEDILASCSENSNGKDDCNWSLDGVIVDTGRPADTSGVYTPVLIRQDLHATLVMVRSACAPQPTNQPTDPTTQSMDSSPTALNPLDMSGGLCGVGAGFAPLAGFALFGVMGRRRHQRAAS